MSINVQELIEAGVHYGHRASRWNPKMRPYIYGKRNLIHIIDLRETVRGLIRATRFLKRTAAQGSLILFVGTKRQAQESIVNYAKQCHMPFVSERWIGGTFTNFRTIRHRLRRLNELEDLIRTGEIEAYSKKRRAQLIRELRKIRRNLAGIRTMNRLPAAMVVIDAKREMSALREARKVGIPTIGLIDTDSDPDAIDLAIPSNDDSLRAIDLLLEKLTTAIKEGLGELPRDQYEKHMAEYDNAHRELIIPKMGEAKADEAAAASATAEPAGEPESTEPAPSYATETESEPEAEASAEDEPVNG